MAGNTINQKGLVWPARRKFIKQAPLALGACLIAPRLAKAAIFQASANPHITYPGPVQPPIAAANGFNTNTVWDDFNDLSTIDVNNTLRPGYNWYMANTMIPQDSSDGTQAAGVIQAPSSVSVNASVLKFNPSASSGGWLARTGYTGNTLPRYVGSPIAASGGYFECKMAFDGSLSGGGSFPIQYWPAFWMIDIQLGLAINDNTNAGFTFPLPELDFMENHDPTHFWWATNDWTSHTALATNTNANQISNMGSPDFASMNTYGTLWLKQSQNSGAGLIQRYFNGQHLAGADVTYSSSTTSPQASGGFTGVYSDYDTSAGYNLEIGSGHNWPIYVDYVQVWQ